MIYRLNQKQFKEHYTKAYHRLILDGRLSVGARFLHTYLQSKPDKWKFYSTAIAEEIGLHRTTVDRYADELEEYGYIERIKMTDDDIPKNRRGQFLGKVWMVFPLPKDEYLELQARGDRDSKTDTDA